ncbi:MAG TPA: DUF5103 domain-containing protein [Bacteroidales bacterium]|nr:DUF5103 domain-containing protein [Bacteroidales bacterium]
MKRTITILAILFSGMVSMGQQEDYYQENYFRYSNHIYDTNIHSLQLHRVGEPLSHPVIDMGNRKKMLRLSFDDFRNNVVDYQYQFIHCNADWKPSELLPSDYLTGFDDDYIEEYEFSYNTRQPYIHYSLAFPQEDMMPVISGNYLLKVYPEGQPEDIILTARFMIADEKVAISANVKQATAPTKMEEWQEVDFTINTKSFYVANPSKNLKVVVQQNNREDNKISGLKPRSIDGNKLLYDYEDQNLFRGGNEFRYFDIQNFKYQSDQVRRIDIFNQLNKVILYADKQRTFSPYVFYDDINGRRLIRTTEYENTAIEADYAEVQFLLPMDAPLVTGGIYIMGELTQWEFNKKSRMTYNYNSKAYETTLYLKQGYYNYMYAFLENGKEQANVRLLENSFSETSNQYTIYVYYRKPGTYQDQLIGMETFTRK